MLGTPRSNPAVPSALLEKLNEVPNADQGYAISVSVNEIILAANEAIGVLYAAQTLLQMLEPDGTVPEGRINTQEPSARISFKPSVRSILTTFC